MRLALLFVFLFIKTIPTLEGQTIAFEILAIDTSSHFVDNRYYSGNFDENKVIRNEEDYRQLFYHYRKLDVPGVRFAQYSMLKRTIKASCMLRIENELQLDSINKQLIWNSSLQLGDCPKETVRHIIIQVPKIPDDYTVLFQQETTEAPSSLNISTDWIDVTQSYQHPNFVYFDDKRRYFPEMGAIIDNDSTFALWQKKGLDCEPLDWNKYMLLSASFGGDCLMRLYHQLWYDPVTHHLILNVYNVWGRCRAGGFRNLLLAIKKPEEGLPLIIQEMKIDDTDEFPFMNSFLNKATYKKN